MRTVEQIKQDIIKEFGFFPPFFEPALSSPGVLENLWQQTLSSYVRNPIPALFKEKLAALIARYCAVPYCLVCHSSTLRPMGMEASEVLKLLEGAPITTRELEISIDLSKNKYSNEFPLKKWPEDRPELEKLILDCSVAIFLHVDNQRCHRWLREALTAEYYDYLMIYISYNRTCLAWAEAHPEMTYEADSRAQNHLGPLIAAEPRLLEFFKNYDIKVQTHADQRLRWLSEENLRLVENEREMNRSLNETVKSLEEEKEVKERFVDTLSHDLRNPLTAVKMNVQMLMRQKSEDQKTPLILARVSKSLERMDRMIENLLDASKIRAGQPLKLEMKSTNLLEVVDQVIEEQKAIVGDRFIIKGESVTGQWNAEALNRVLENLIGNAVKHGDEKGSITVKVEADENIARICVHNYGKAMSKDNLNDIFNPFFRVGNANKGWGIGLSIVKGLVEAHQGSIKVESEENMGTTFKVELPL